jgi:hypothetical protein
MYTRTSQKACCGFGSGSVGSVCFGPPGSATGSFSHKYGSGSRFFHHRAKSKKNLDFYCFLTSLWFFVYEEWRKCTSVPDPDPNPYVFGLPGSASWSVSQRYGSENPHPNPYQNLTDPQHCRKHCYQWELEECHYTINLLTYFWVFYGKLIFYRVIFNGKLEKLSYRILVLLWVKTLKSSHTSQGVSLKSQMRR